jgi:hypothetical protein
MHENFGVQLEGVMGEFDPNTYSKSIPEYKPDCELTP